MHLHPLFELAFLLEYPLIHFLYIQILIIYI